MLPERRMKQVAGNSSFNKSYKVFNLDAEVTQTPEWSLQIKYGFIGVVKIDKFCSMYCSKRNPSTFIGDIVPLIYDVTWNVYSYQEWTER